MFNIKKVMLSAALCVLANTQASAETIMHVGSWLPPTHPQNAIVLPTWAKWIEEATQGEVKLQVSYNLGHPKDLFSLVEDGVVDAAWSSTGYVPGRFELTQVVELPLLGTNAEAASVAYWRIHEKYLKKANEFSGLEVVGLFTHAPGQIHTLEPISSLSDLKGRKIRLGGGVMNELAEKMGAVGVSAPAGKVYEMMQQGVIDGTFLPVCEQRTLRLNEIARNLTLLPGGMYQTSFAVFINPDFLGSLSEEIRTAILNVSGEKLSRLAGQAWEQCGDEALQESIDKGVSVKMVKVGEPMAAEFQEIATGIDDEWLTRVASKGVDASAALAELRQTARNLEAQK
ncbi:TRAP transporter substrate-binding protein [Candidatus Thalassolituus haligoni]|uniref:TRAP transporter substrate-binding protein n=1 Tax=Candidatus Thalassolituus haligoni TaxID=3100113 RepID=UPI0035118C12